MTFVHGAGFRICGVIARKWVSNSGKFAALTLEVNTAPKSKRIECKVFATELVDQISRHLGEGMTVEVTGQIEMEKLVDKEKKAIQVNGYDKWAPSLVIKAIKTEGATEKKPLPPLDEGEPDL